MSSRQLAEFSDYEGMLAAIRARVRELEIQGREFDEFAGLPAGYLSKLIAAGQVRRIGWTTMGPLFDALGIKCVMFEDPEATARLKSRLQPRNGSFVRPTRTHYAMTDRKWRRIQKLGSATRWQKFSKSQRRQIMRALANRRWGR